MSDLSMQCAYYFIKQMLDTEADSFSMKIEGVKKEGVVLGDYELTVKKLEVK